MKIVKYFKHGLYGLFVAQATVFAHFEADINGPLVQKDTEGNKFVNPLFTPELTTELHYFCKRTYRLSSREKDEHGFISPERIVWNRSNHFSYPQEDTHWTCYRPFIGTHGTNQLKGLAGFFIQEKVEVDYAGFVAYKQATETTPPIIAIVFRGSQSNDFQSQVSPSWLTNFAADKMDYPQSLELKANFHRGFLEKYLASRLSIVRDISSCVYRIPKEQWPNIRFILTGHSQGAGICMPAALDIVNQVGPRVFGENFNNVETPRFFVYMLSSPNSIGNQETNQLVNTIVGKDNIIRHASVFDVVPYLCLGENYNTWLGNKFLKLILGMEAGYIPAGHLALDDPLKLEQKSLNLSHIDYDLGTLEQTLEEAYSYAMSIYNYSGFKGMVLNKPYKFMVLHHICQNSRAVGGLGSFILINHYSSCTAYQANPIDKKQVRDPEKYGYSFDPRLPETLLNVCLKRGSNHCAVMEGKCPFENYNQIFYPDLSYLDGYYGDMDTLTACDHYDAIASVEDLTARDHSDDVSSDEVEEDTHFRFFGKHLPQYESDYEEEA